MAYIILILFIVSLILFLLGDHTSVIYLKKNYYNLKRYQARKKLELLQNDLNQELKNAGFPFDLYRYQLTRYSLTAVFTIIVLLQKEINFIYLIMVLVFFVITVPKKRILRMKSPLMTVIDKTIEKRKKNYNLEIGLFVIIMNNNMNMYKNHPPSAYRMVQEAMIGTKKTKPIFEQLLRYWQTNKIQEGINYLVKTIDTDEAKKLGLLLSKLNELHPSELKEQLIAQKEIFRKKRQTERKNKIKNQNYYVFAVVTGMLMVILLNIAIGVIEINGGIDL